MALETLSSSELLNFIIYETLSATPFSFNNNSSSFYHHTQPPPPRPPAEPMRRRNSSCLKVESNSCSVQQQNNKQRKKRRRRPKVCKNKEEAETQRMTHIAVERNRRRQMNDHLAVLRSLMPPSYVQRGDQASIVGGAIEYVKELEHMLQSLEAQKFLLLKQNNDSVVTTTVTTADGHHQPSELIITANPFVQFFAYPQYTSISTSSPPSKFTSKSKGSVTDIEVNLIETHANVRVLSRKRVRQVSKMVAAFQALYLTILHLSVTTLDPLVLYSISAKVEEGCQFSSADEIAGGVDHILRIIEEETTITSTNSLCCPTIGLG